MNRNANHRSCRIRNNIHAPKKAVLKMSAEKKRTRQRDVTYGCEAAAT